MGGFVRTCVRRANRIRIQHRHGQVVAVVEIVSPGNKDSASALRAFVRKTSDLIGQVAVGDALPALPILLTRDEYIPAPLEETYQASWAAVPADSQELLELPTQPAGAGRRPCVPDRVRGPAAGAFPAGRGARAGTAFRA